MRSHKPPASQAMEHAASKQQEGEHLIQLSAALGEIRDSLVTLSLALTDLLTDSPTTARDEVLLKVERYLSHLHEGNGSGSE